MLISDLYEGGVRDEMLQRIAAMLDAGVQVIVLLALSDSGAPSFDRENAAALAALGVPAFACTPDAFPDLLAVALQRGDVARLGPALPGRPLRLTRVASQTCPCGPTSPECGITMTGPGIIPVEPTGNTWCDG